MLSSGDSRLEQQALLERGWRLLASIEESDATIARAAVELWHTDERVSEALVERNQAFYSLWVTGRELAQLRAGRVRWEVEQLAPRGAEVTVVAGPT